jgi:membrane-bound lytic murein transglycosylase A
MQKLRINNVVFFIFILILVGLRVYYSSSIQPKPPIQKVLSPTVETIKLEAVAYTDLPGWQAEGLEQTLKTFQVSCRWILKRKPEAAVGNDRVPLKAEDWFQVCREAMTLNDVPAAQIKQFFERAFVPLKWSETEDKTGLFTGYYSPVYAGSLHKDQTHQVPLYGLPNDMITVQLRRFDPTLPARHLTGRVTEHHLSPYYTRREINQGAIHGRAPVLAWMKSEVDRLFLEIQGAGAIKLTDGNKLILGYAGENGAPYHSVAQALINRGVMTKDNASMQTIRHYVQAHPKEGQRAMNENPSFVFFNLLSKAYTPGTQGIPLTPGYSMAVDQKWVPLGVPLWLNTKRPDEHHPEQALALKRLMIAQDTGGAIRGKVRGDVYWGSGKDAARIAGRMKYVGNYWLLLPKHWVQTHIES